VSELLQHAHTDAIAPGYLASTGEQVAIVHHRAAEPRRGAVLILGPFAAERERAHLSLVRFARTLAAEGFDALRFDFRGVGESAGRFEDQTFSTWRDDARAAFDQLASIAPGVPLALIGVRLGALLAADLFSAGLGDRLLLWAPPESGRALLWETLRRTLTAEMMASPDAPRRTREQLAAELEAGRSVNVHNWTLKPAQDGDTRPRLSVDFRPSSSPSATTSERFWEAGSRLAADTTDLFARSRTFLAGGAP
jgi:alpha-beta hydrolase superfamily lysophospholipase